MEELTCATCPFDVEQPNGRPFCIQDAGCEISVNWLNEYEQKIYNQALDDAIDFFMNHIHCNNNNPVVKDYVCEQLEKMKK